MIRGLAGVMVWSAAGSAASYDGGAGGDGRAAGAAGSAGPDSFFFMDNSATSSVSYGNQLAGGFFSAVMIGGGMPGRPTWHQLMGSGCWFIYVVRTRFVFACLY